MLTYLQLLGSVFFWGATWISGRIIAQDMGPFSAAFLRFAAASCFLYFWCCRLNGRPPKIPRKHLPGLLLLGLSGVFCYNFFFFSGLKTVTAGRAALIIACIPVVLCLASALLFKDRLTLHKIIGTLLSLLGVSIVLAQGSPLSLLSQPLSSGDLMILGCVCSWTVYSLAGNKVMQNINPLEAVMWSCIIGDILLFPFALHQGLLSDMLQAKPIDWTNLLFLGIMATGLAFTWYYKGIQAIGPSRAAIFINLVPVFALSLGFIILGEAVSWSLLGGGILILSGVYLTNRPST